MRYGPDAPTRVDQRHMWREGTPRHRRTMREHRDLAFAAAGWALAAGVCLVDVRLAGLVVQYLAHLGGH